MNTLLKQSLTCLCLLAALLPAAQSHAAAAPVPTASISVQSTPWSAGDRTPEQVAMPARIGEVPLSLVLGLMGLGLAGLGTIGRRQG